MRFPEPPGRLAELEEEILRLWKEEDAFGRAQRAARGREPFVFYEGPPTANGRPGLHHVISRAIKDLVCRYQTMKGKRVTRIAGWDTHGLPVELETQKRLGIKDKREIEQRGIGWFNEECRKSVFTYKREWREFSERIAYWLDYERPYATYEPRYIESVWWLLRQMADRGLLYRSRKVVPWCPVDETALSSHEVALGYKDVEDPSLYLKVELADGSGRHALVWTTTPWTLLSNAALAVDPEIEYVEAREEDGPALILARARLDALMPGARVLRSFSGRELAGIPYRRPFSLIPRERFQGERFKIVEADFVEDAEGSGIVHVAPAYGQDDFAIGKRLGLAVVEPLSELGTFDDDVPLVGGMFFKDADAPLIQDLAERGLVFRSESKRHSYPHCWRCGSPLIYMARRSWFARTSKLREELLENNRRVSWKPPEVGRGRFGDWLQGNVDWTLSRDRYWGTPLPAWVSEDDPENVHWIGSFAELSELSGGLSEDFDPHRPCVDRITWRCPKSGSVMRRTPEVLDVWFDSGAMPWAQWHYPFENKDAFREHFPADFICEAVDQTRGWFYSLHAISTMLGSGPAFRNVVVNDLILDASGRKMSKSKGNVVDPWREIEEHGADAIRWYLVTVSNPWLPTRYDASAVRGSAARFFDTLLNAYRFFSLYANVEGWEPEAPAPAFSDRPAMDRWLLSRLSALCRTARDELDAYQPTRAYRAVAEFVDADLSNWYVRRSRARFWGNAKSEDAGAAFSTLFECLRAVALIVAPIAPFFSDWLHRALAGRSSHLESFPKAEARHRDKELEDGMRHARALCRLARSARDALGIPVRQPLRLLLAGAPGPAIKGELLQLLADEVNVREIRFATSVEEVSTIRGVPDFRALGRRFGAATQEAATAIRGMAPEGLRRIEDGKRAEIQVNGSTQMVSASEVRVAHDPRPGWALKRQGEYFAALDPRITDELLREGIARELVSRIQRLRKESGLEITDRVKVRLASPDRELLRAAREHAQAISKETLAVELQTEAPQAELDACDRVSSASVSGRAARIGVSVA